MSCGCSKQKGTFENPVIAGRANGAEPVQVVATRSLGRIKVGQPTWVTGSALADWIERGYVTPA